MPKNTSYQMTVFDLLPRPSWTEMTLKQLAAYIGEQTGLLFIPDTRFHGEYSEYIAYYTSKLFFTLGLDYFETCDEDNGKPFISVGWENKKEMSGGDAPCDTLEDAIDYFRSAIARNVHKFGLH